MSETSADLYQIERARQVEKRAKTAAWLAEGRAERRAKMPKSDIRENRSKKGKGSGSMLESVGRACDSLRAVMDKNPEFKAAMEQWFKNILNEAKRAKEAREALSSQSSSTPQLKKAGGSRRRGSKAKASL